MDIQTRHVRTTATVLAQSSAHYLAHMARHSQLTAVENYHLQRRGPVSFEHRGVLHVAVLVHEAVLHLDGYVRHPLLQLVLELRLFKLQSGTLYVVRFGPYQLVFIDFRSTG